MPIIDSSIYKTMTFDSFENLGQQIWQPSNMSHFFNATVQAMRLKLFS